MILAFALAAPAHACSCEPVYVDEHPADGAEGVPRDAVIRLAGPLVDVPLGVQFEVHEDGVYRTDVVEETRRFGSYWVYEARPAEPFAPGARVELIDRSNGRQPWLTFTVGDTLDGDPPAWDGAYDVRTTVDHPDQCGARQTHTFAWTGLADDGWDTADLLVMLEPVDEDHAGFGGFGDGLVLRNWPCWPADPTLAQRLHRAYRVTVEDGSGNPTATFEIDTRPGCGCASTGPVPASVGLLLLGLAAFRRQQARSGFRICSRHASAWSTNARTCGSSQRRSG